MARSGGRRNNDDGATDGRERREATLRSHLFTVRVWKEEAADGSEYRGSVREVASGAFRNFRDWSDLPTFMIERVEEYEPGTDSASAKEARMIAVMGAAGNVGSKVTDLLLRRSEEVRVFEHERKLEEFRERGAERVRGDATNVDDLRALFEDAVAALVLLPENLADPQFVTTRSEMSRAIADAVRESQVSHVVALSAAGADQEDVVGPPAGLREYEDRLFDLEDVNVLVLRSAFYMDYLLANLPLIQSQKINGSAIRGDLRFPMVATRDVAHEAAERLASRDFERHRVKLLLGPEDVSMREATRAMGSLLGLPELPYVEFPPADMRGALLAAGMSEEAASLLVDMQLALNEGRPFGEMRRTSEATTPTRLEEYLKHALGSSNAGGLR
ncbi:MAG TPA: NAD(P)H-binding protein [Rubrobacteraceae bacterium]|nr:NAD(P)H-binding protein [Rubrobacteraceae bacterium]